MCKDQEQIKHRKLRNSHFIENIITATKKMMNTPVQPGATEYNSLHNDIAVYYYNWFFEKVQNSLNLTPLGFVMFGAG